jgi:C-terminal processing protease CtpA/Prc/tricorn protease-like protein
LKKISNPQITKLCLLIKVCIIISYNLGLTKYKIERLMTRFLYALTLSILASIFVSTNNYAQILARYPDLNPLGDKITFSYQGDIWIANTDGSEPNRITIHEAYDSHPRWSQDGMHIAFVSNRFGNKDIFSYSIESGQIERKTYYSSNDLEPAWKADGELVFRTDRAYQQLEREDEIYEFNKSSATPSRAIDAFALAAEPAYDSDLWILTKGYCRTTREAYTGPAQQDLWLYNNKDETYSKLTDHKGQDIQARWADDRIYILSARNGSYNIYQTPFENGEKGEWQNITNVKKPGIRYFDVSQDGETIIYERGASLFIKKGNQKARKIELDVPSDYKFYPEEYKTYSGNLSNYSISPNEEYAALQIHGELFLTANDDEKDRTVRLTSHPFKDVNPTWLNDSTALFISDRNGKEAVYKIKSDDEEISDLFWTFKHELEPIIERDGIITNLSIAPNKDRIIITYEPGILEIASIDTTGNIGEFTKLLEGWAMPSDISWSPDGDWVAYAQSDLNFNREVYILACDGSNDPINVSMHPRSDHSPVWSRDGQKLAFISNRNNGDDDVWLAWLQEEDYLKDNTDWKNLEDYPEALKARLKMQKDTAAKDSVIIDTKYIHRRLAQVTRYAGDERSICFDNAGEHIYFIRSNRDDRELMKIKWNGEDAEKIADAKGVRSITLGPSGDHLYFIQRGNLMKYKHGGKKADKIPFKARMKIDFEAEKEQVFEEAWRQLDANFYDPDFHGRDFQALKKQYKPIAMKASTKQDFRDMFNEMLGQINASHMGLYGRNREDVQRTRSGKIGAELKATSNGWKVMRVIPKTPADKEESKLMEGDLITSIDGKTIMPDKNAFSLLEDKVDERIWLSVTGKDGEERDVYLRCNSSISNELYDEWVAKRRKLTEEYSDGKLGYIHIRGMNWPSFEAFERELMASGYGKDGIVIDVRFNGGGWTTDMLLTVLNVRQHAYTIPRGAAADLDQHEKFRSYYPYGERLPLSAWTKPAATLCNHTSYSNAEIFSHAFKNLNIGPLVGEPTFGAVISTGGARLLDGSFIRLPFRGWFIKKSGRNMDFQPAVPDHIVIHPPAVKANGEDPQLKKAVEVLLEQNEN